MNGRLLHSLWRIWKIRSLGAPVWSLCWYLSTWVWTRFAIKKTLPFWFFEVCTPCSFRGIHRAISQYFPRGLNCVRALGDLKRKAKKLWTDHILSFAARLEIWDYQKPRKPNFPKAIDRDSNDQLVTCFISKRSQQDRTFEIQHYGKKTGSRTVALLNITFKINRKTRNIFSRDVGVSVQLWYIISLELYISLFFDPELN